MADDQQPTAAQIPDEPEHKLTPNGPLHTEEPPVADEDTQPRVAAESSPSAGSQPVPPVDVQAASLMADPDDWARGRVRTPTVQETESPRRTSALLLITVMLGTVCLCMAMVGLAGFAGYRDGLATNDVRVTQTLATGIAQQYATGAADLQAGYAELAAARFEWIVETIQAPTEYALDSPVQLAVARTIAAFTPTPQPTLTPSLTPTEPAIATPSLTPTQAATATAQQDSEQSTQQTPQDAAQETEAEAESMQNPAYLYEQALTARRVARFEEAIEWLDALIALDPTYKPAEVRRTLVDTLSELGHIYLSGMNEDGEDRLARGVYLVYRADDLGTVEPEWLLGQAIFVERYINARNYVNGGYYETALPILQELCTESCDWSYAGVSVRDLLERAQAGAN